MEFKSLEEAFTSQFIKSIPHLTRLALTANEIKIIELVLSFRRNGMDFYMNYKNIAEYLVIGDTKHKAKSVGNIIRKLEKKKILMKDTTSNFNGANGGSSAKLYIDEPLLDKLLQEVFRKVVVDAPIAQPDAPQAFNEPGDSTESLKDDKPSKSFIQELQEMDENAEQNQPSMDDFIATFEDEVTGGIEADSYRDIPTVEEFKQMLQQLLRGKRYSSQKLSILHMIDNPKDWDIDTMKEAFVHLVLSNIE